LVIEWKSFARGSKYGILGNLRKKTTNMRRKTQFDRIQALPVKQIHGGGTVFSARYR
jgi:hypothetical protein